MAHHKLPLSLASVHWRAGAHRSGNRDQNTSPSAPIPQNALLSTLLEECS